MMAPGIIRSTATTEARSRRQGRAQFRALAVADFDGDGDADVAVGNDAGSNSIFFNNGSGLFGAGQAVGDVLRPTYALAAADFNADGHIDLAAGNRDARNELFINDAAGQFLNKKNYACTSSSDSSPNSDTGVEGVGADPTPQPQGLSIPLPLDPGCTIAGEIALLADLNQDGWLDIVTSGGQGNELTPINVTFFGPNTEITERLSIRSGEHIRTSIGRG